MGDVIDLQRRRGNRTTVGAEPEPPDRAEPDREPVPDPAAASTEPEPVPVWNRPEWLGVRRHHRHAAGNVLWRWYRRMAKRFLFEITHVPHRTARFLKYFGRGVAGRRDSDTGTWGGGWIALASWCFAGRERKDAHALAAEQPGAELRGTQTADRIAWWHSGVLIVPHIVGAAVLEHYLDAWWLVFAPLIVATTIYGYRIEPRPPAPIAAPRERQDVTIEAMNQALQAVGILAKPTAGNPTPDGVRLAASPRIVGGGQETQWDLPASCGKEAADVTALRGRLAGAFSTPVEQFIVEPGSHPGQFVVWQTDKDPFAGSPPEHPVLDAKEWDVWEPVPFGRDARGRRVTMSLVFTSLLIGARPRRGKSLSARSALAAAVLDPHVRFHIFDGKGGGSWSAMKPLAATYVEGADDPDTGSAAEILDSLVADMRNRHRRLPGSKLTRNLARDPGTDCPVTFVVVDEAQEYLDSPHGARITDALTRLAKVGPSSGYCLILITQRPDQDSFPSGLRAVFGARFALEVMSYHDSNIILGPNMSKLGYDASQIRHRGVGLLRPDDNADDEPRTVRAVRTYNMSDHVWDAICRTGAALREHTGLGQVPQNGNSAVYATPSELFAQLTAFTPHVLEEAGATDPHSMGMRLPIRKEPRKVNRRGVYDVRRAEVALGLAPGCLGAPSDLPPGSLEGPSELARLGDADDLEAGASQLGGTSEAGASELPSQPSSTRFDAGMEN